MEVDCNTISLQGSQDSCSTFSVAQLQALEPHNEAIFSLFGRSSLTQEGPQQNQDLCTYHKIFSEHHMCIDNFQYVCGELVHIFQRHDLKCYQALLILSEEKTNKQKTKKTIYSNMKIDA